MENINFAQTFKPEKQYISCILRLAKDSLKMTAKEISLETGIPTGERSGKVIPHIEYSKYMGLITVEKENDKMLLEQTDLGKLVFNEDASLMEPLTIFLAHLMLSREKKGAPIWNKVFSFILPKYKTSIIPIDDLIKELNLFYDNKINRKNFAPFVNSYQDLFKSLNLLTLDNNKDNIVKLINPKIKHDYIYLYMYALLCYWEELYPNRLEISADEFKLLNFGNKLFNTSDKEYEILDLLCSEDLICLNRQLSPYTIVINISKDKIINKLYSELF